MNLFSLDFPIIFLDFLSHHLKPKVTFLIYFFISSIAIKPKYQYTCKFESWCITILVVLNKCISVIKYYVLLVE